MLVFIFQKVYLLKARCLDAAKEGKDLAREEQSVIGKFFGTISRELPNQPSGGLPGEVGSRGSLDSFMRKQGVF